MFDIYDEILQELQTQQINIPNYVYFNKLFSYLQKHFFTYVNSLESLRSVSESIQVKEYYFTQTIHTNVIWKAR